MFVLSIYLDIIKTASFNVKLSVNPGAVETWAYQKDFEFKPSSILLACNCKLLLRKASAKGVNTDIRY